MRAPGPDDLTVGASHDGRLNMWVGWVHDGRRLMPLPPRATRDRAMKDAQTHKDRLMHPPVPKRIWSR